MTDQKLNVAIVGGGMIVNDQILPSLYHLQRLGVVGQISICARHCTPLKALAESAEFATAFPGHSFTPHPALDEPADVYHAELYKEVIAGLAPRQIVIAAVPENMHYPVTMTALAHDQNVLCVKPLVMTHNEAAEIEFAAFDKGLFVGVEYHKRFDRRALLARKSYQAGQFGDFVMGDAKLLEPYLYRDSNFQNWFTCDHTDPFVYIGCHYVDQVHFITGLLPQSVSVVGVKGSFPNGNVGFMWANGRVVFENGGVLSVVTGLGYPNEGAGSNDQGMVMYFEGDSCTGMIEHDDQFRGMAHTFTKGAGPGGSAYNYINPDYFKLIPWIGDGLQPVGYGYESIAANLQTIQRIEAETRDLEADEVLERRQQLIAQVDAQGLIATPANSAFNELVTEAARLSILNDGVAVDIVYGDQPHVQRRWSA